MPRPVHFEIHATEPEKLKTFYERLFGWSFTQWGDVPYWLINTGDGDPMNGKPHSEPGIDGGMLPRQGDPAEDGAGVNSFVVTVDVPDCQAFLDKAVAEGGTVAVPRGAIEGVGWNAYFKDPDGNLVGIMESDSSAS